MSHKRMANFKWSIYRKGLIFSMFFGFEHCANFCGRKIDEAISALQKKS